MVKTSEKNRKVKSQTKAQERQNERDKRQTGKQVQRNKTNGPRRSQKDRHLDSRPNKR